MASEQTVQIEPSAPATGGRWRLPDVVCCPLEHEVVRRSAELLERYGWPFGRIPVRIEFGIRVKVPSNHDLTFDGTNGRGELVGRVRLWFNYLYLRQNVDVFYTDILPHEIAHLLAGLQAQSQNREIDQHGEEWQKFLLALSPGAHTKVNALLSLFDDRPIRIHKGEAPSECKCAGPARFGTFGVNAPRNKPCKGCASIPKPIPLEQIPESIAAEIVLIRSFEEQEEIYGWLSG